MANEATPAPIHVGSDAPFYVSFAVLGSTYIFLVVAMIVADFGFTSRQQLFKALASPEIRYAIKLSLISCTITAILSLWVSIPLGYLLSRYQFVGKAWVDA